MKSRVTKKSLESLQKNFASLSRIKNVDFYLEKKKKELKFNVTLSVLLYKKEIKEQQSYNVSLIGVTWTKMKKVLKLVLDLLCWEY